MDLISVLRSLDRDQKAAFTAAFLGWCLDAFDFFVLVFVIKDVAHEFHATKTSVAFAVTATLATRPIGALLFGVLADRFGRRGPLIADIILYSGLELLSGFAPTLTAFLVLRALFGIGMGGEWGLGASLALESVPAEKRGALSGLLQEGYVVGYLLAAVVYGIAFKYVGWRGMFFIGAAPALLSLFILAKVKESPVWLQQRQKIRPAMLWSEIRTNFGLFAYLVLLMAGFNFMSHGTQDIYPTMLQTQYNYTPHTVGKIAVIYNVGALLGGILFGSWSQKIGRRRAIVLATLLAIPMIPLWAFSHTAAMLAVGAFLLQFMIQGAWGVIPAHLTELAPALVRGTFIGFAYQCGNLIASVIGPLQTSLGEHHFHGNFSLALSLTVTIAVIAVCLIAGFGKERHGADLTDAH